MFCPKCGTKNPNKGKYCRKCGSDLELVSDALSGKLSRSGN
ncbi:MAG: zinc ribbon domain-containing protein, partial [Acidobacteria bacterium]|nr:zinc ribbon domain-containing protein [Acidobacteriota bacterium]